MNKTFLVILFVIYTIALLFATLAPGEMIKQVTVFKLHDKLLHMASFGVWSGLLFTIYVFHGTGLNRVSVIKSILFGIIFGALIEVLQITLPVYRSFEYADIVADGIGSVVFVLVLNQLFKSTKSVLF
jgi:VanZ family protein